MIADIYMPHNHECWIQFHDTYQGPDAFIPAHAGDSGVDLYSTIYARILPGERKVIPCGISLKLPVGMEAQIRPKSGRALKDGLVVANSPGTIDSGYRGEIQVIAHNLNPLLKLDTLAKAGKSIATVDGVHVRALDLAELFARLAHDALGRVIEIQPGDKVAQLVIAQFARPRMRVVDDVSNATSARGAGGFGSTGVA